jgi:hypothetical protein
MEPKRAPELTAYFRNVSSGLETTTTSQCDTAKHENGRRRLVSGM